MTYKETLQDLYDAHEADDLQEVYVIAHQIKTHAPSWSPLERFVAMAVTNATIQSLTLDE